MGAFNTRTSSTFDTEAEEGTLTVNATDDFAGGIVTAGASLKVTLNQLIAEGVIAQHTAKTVYGRFLVVLEEAMENAE